MAAINNSGVINNTADTKQTLSINNTGTINVTSAASPAPATYELANTLTGSAGTINISQHGTLQLDTAASGNNIVFGDATGGLTILQLSSFSPTMSVVGLQAGDVITLPNLPNGFKEIYSQATGVLTLTTSTGTALGSITFGGASHPSLATVQNAVVKCFVAGTLIGTPDGVTPVEALKAGDLVRLYDGGTGTIEWVGSRYVDCRRHPNPEQVWPFRIVANAFAPGIPNRDLMLSPDHAVFVDGVLVPVKLLDNGNTIRQEKLAGVSYHHMEMRDHEIVMAEGLTVETLLPGTDKTAFEGQGTLLELHPNFSIGSWDTMGRAPLVMTGPELEKIRRRLRRRASTIAPRRRRRANHG